MSNVIQVSIYQYLLDQVALVAEVGDRRAAFTSASEAATRDRTTSACRACRAAARSSADTPL